MKKTLSLFAAALLLGACTKDLDIDFDDMEPQVVVMSCVEPDTTLSLRLNYSRFFLSSQPFAAIDNAAVSLSVNGGSALAPTSAAGGNYAFALRPQPGDRFDLQVDVPGKGTVAASTTVPAAPQVDNISASLTETDGHDRIYSLRFTLHDPDGEDNFYLIRCLARRYFVYSGTVEFEDDYRPFTCNDYMLTEGMDMGTLLDGDNPGEFSGRSLFFTDANINGRGHEVALSTELYYNDRELYLEITSYSRDRYLYEITADQYTDDPFESLIAEPVQVHTNIDGGIGIFAARTRTLVPIPLPQ